MSQAEGTIDVTITGKLRDIADAIAEIPTAIRNQTVSLSLTMPSSGRSGYDALAAVIAAFRQSHPELSVTLVHSETG